MFADNRIVTSHYRYKRPPRKRAKATAIDIEPLIVTAKQPKPRTSGDPPVKRLGKVVLAADIVQPTPPGAAIVTARRPKARGGNRHLLAELPDTEEEHRAIGDRADALFQEMKRQIAEKIRS